MDLNAFILCSFKQCFTQKINPSTSDYLINKNNLFSIEFNLLKIIVNKNVRYFTKKQLYIKFVTNSLSSII